MMPFSFKASLPPHRYRSDDYLHLSFMLHADFSTTYPLLNTARRKIRTAANHPMAFSCSNASAAG